MNSSENNILLLVARWNAYVVDGHDIEALCRCLFEAAQVKEKPTVLICKTFKGKGIPGQYHFVIYMCLSANKNVYHKPFIYF